MKLEMSSTCITTNSIAQVRAFYEKHFQATITFECDWYVALRLGNEAREKGLAAVEICLMQPRAPGTEYLGGITINIRADDVDALHTRLIKEGITPVMPLEDHAWGDRGFCIMDPAKVRLYFYRDIEPSPEFKKAFKTPQGS